MEKGLPEFEYSMRELIRNNADGIIVINAEGVVLFANPAAELLFGRESDDLIGELFGFPVFGGKTTEIDILRKGSEPLIAEMRMVETVFDGHKAYLASIRDVSDRKMIEKEQNLAIIQLELEKKDLERRLRPQLETATGIGSKFIPEARTSYLIEGNNSTKAFELFQDLVHNGYHGLCITRHHPEKFRNRYDLLKTPFIWLTANHHDQEVCIRPSEISKITTAIQTFIECTEQNVVLLSGVECLVAQNGFKSILNLLYVLNDLFMKGKGTLLVSLNPITFSDQEINILRSELFPLTDASVLSAKIRGESRGGD
jgi:hypothetical protein